MKMKNWRTTLAGMIGAAVVAGLAIFQQGEVDPEAIATAAAIAAIGYLAKDAGVSGTER
jgi:hypothetical protein